MQLIWNQQLIILNHAKTNISKKGIEKMNEQNQAQSQAQSQAQNNQATNETVNQYEQLAQNIAKSNEAKTLVNGQEVTLQEAKSAEESFNKQNTQTGIQAHHDNSTEAVQAGQVAQNAATTLDQDIMKEYEKAKAKAKTKKAD